LVSIDHPFGALGVKRLVASAATARVTMLSAVVRQDKRHISASPSLRLATAISSLSLTARVLGS
jgi:hypothetical protein